MVCNGLFHLLITHADVAPCDHRTGVLQKPLDKHDVMTVVVVDACSVPLAETVCADVLIVEEVANKLEMVLDLANGDREQKLVLFDSMFPSVGRKKAVDLIGDGELAALSRLFLHHVQAVSAAVLHDVGHMQAQNVSNAHSQVCLGCEDRRHSWIRAAVPKAVQKGLDDGGVLSVG